MLVHELIVRDNKLVQEIMLKHNFDEIVAAVAALFKQELFLLTVGEDGLLVEWQIPIDALSHIIVNSIDVSDLKGTIYVGETKSKGIDELRLELF